MKLSKFVFILGGILLNCIPTVAFSETIHVGSIAEANTVGEPGDTILIAPGTYTDTLRPRQSGEPNRYIVFKPDGGDVTITSRQSGINLIERSYIKVEGLNLIDNGGVWVNMTGELSHHNIIDNCFMEGSRNYGGVTMSQGAHHNKLLNSTLNSTCPCESACFKVPGESGYGGPSDLIMIWDGSYNLIDNNLLLDGPHDAVDIQDRADSKGYPCSYNIFRNNIMQNKLHTNFDSWGVEYLLIENNQVLDAGEEQNRNLCGNEDDFKRARWQHKGIGLNTKYAIIRNNLSVNNGYGLSLISDPRDWTGPSVENRAYCNTFAQNQKGVLKHLEGEGRNNILKNNIFYNNYQDVTIVDREYGSSYIFVTNNMIGSTDPSVLNPPSVAVFEDQLSIEPQFVDFDNRDFHLADNSPMIDAGTWLTTTRNSGSGEQIPVVDARYFMDGWGLIEGDTIQFEGDNTRAKIIAVDYDNNQIVVDKRLNWDNGQGISLAYTGEKPDIGAYEHGLADSGGTGPTDEPSEGEYPYTVSGCAGNISRKDRINDDDIGTHWWHYENGTAWITCDLGSAKDISGVNIYANSQNLQIFVDDVRVWSGSVVNSTWNECNFTANGRYIKVQSTEGGTFTPEFYEIDILGSPSVD